MWEAPNGESKSRARIVLVPLDFVTVVRWIVPTAAAESASRSW